MDYSITYKGKALAESKYSIDLDNKIFGSDTCGLVIDFSDYGWTFKTSGNCTFKTRSGCMFNTGEGCTFNTGGDCTFNTGKHCAFHTGYNCSFDTGWGCIFKTGGRCTFDTEWGCTFSVFGICSQKFKLGSSGVMIDREGGKHYLLNEEFIRLQKIIKG